MKRSTNPPSMKNDSPVHPVHATGGKSNAVVPQLVTLRAYEVYSAVYGPQIALITDGCRGGFSVGELIAFLYAYSFPKEEWSKRVDEAFRGMIGIDF